jgi:hypothetical protein
MYKISEKFYHQVAMAAKDTAVEFGYKDEGWDGDVFSQFVRILRRVGEAALEGFASFETDSLSIDPMTVWRPEWEWYTARSLVQRRDESDIEFKKRKDRVREKRTTIIRSFWNKIAPVLAQERAEWRRSPEGQQFARREAQRLAVERRAEILRRYATGSTGDQMAYALTRAGITPEQFG